MSPHELYFGRKANLGHLKVFSSLTYLHVPKEKQRKLDSKAEKCILAKYSDKQKGYHFIIPRLNRFELAMMLYLTNQPLGIDLCPV